jgi:hypothetical protein
MGALIGRNGTVRCQVGGWAGQVGMRERGIAPLSHRRHRARDLIHADGVRDRGSEPQRL